MGFHSSSGMRQLQGHRVSMMKPPREVSHSKNVGTTPELSLWTGLCSLRPPFHHPPTPVSHLAFSRPKIKSIEIQIHPFLSLPCPPNSANTQQTLLQMDGPEINKSFWVLLRINCGAWSTHQPGRSSERLNLRSHLGPKEPESAFLTSILGNSYVR